MKKPASGILCAGGILLAAAVGTLLLPACTLPQLSTEGKVTCYLRDREHDAPFDYPTDAASREKLAAWLRHSESKYYSHLFFNWIPEVTVNLTDGTRVHVHSDFVHIETKSILQRKRSRTAEDDAFCDYLKLIAPKKTATAP